MRICWPEYPEVLGEKTKLYLDSRRFVSCLCNLDRLLVTVISSSTSECKPSFTQCHQRVISFLTCNNNNDDDNYKTVSALSMNMLPKCVKLWSTANNGGSNSGFPVLLWHWNQYQAVEFHFDNNHTKHEQNLNEASAKRSLLFTSLLSFSNWHEWRVE